jgi:uroporphyrin-3 C-methyltransferase
MTENKKHEQDPDSIIETSSVTPNAEKTENVAPEAVTSKSTTSEANTTDTKKIQKNKETNAATKWLISSSLLFSVSALTASGWLYYQSLQHSFEQDINQLNIQQNSLDHKLGTSALNQSQLTALIKQVKILEQNNQEQAAQIATTQTRQNEQLQSFDAKLSRLDNTTKEDWKLAEAEYLIRLANQRLLLESDSKGAVTLLSNADDILNELQDPIVFATRKALATDIQALNAISTFDLEGAYLQLNALYENLGKLPQKEPSKEWQASTTEKDNSETSNTTVGTIKSTLDSFWQSLRSLIVINYDHTPIRTLLPPAEYQELLTGLQLQIDVAQVALIKGEAAIYQQALSRVASAITEHFDTQSESVISFLSNLNAVQKINPAPELPQPRNSLIAIKSLMESWTKQGTTSSSSDTPTLSTPESLSPENNIGDKI